MKTIYCSLWFLDCLTRSITFEQNGWNVPRKFDPAEQTKPTQAEMSNLAHNLVFVKQRDFDLFIPMKEYPSLK